MQNPVHPATEDAKTRTTFDTLPELALQTFNATQKESMYVVPAAWDNASLMTPFLFYRSWIWKSLEILSEQLNIRQAIACATPYAWQLSNPVHVAASVAKVPNIFVQPTNLSLLKMYIEEVGVDIIIISAAHIRELLTLLETVAKKPLAIVVVHPAHQIPFFDRTFSTSILITHEVHLVPGLTLLYQDSDLLKEDGAANHFFITDECEWTFSPDTRVTAKENVLVPFKDLALPFNVVPVDTALGTYAIRL